MTKVKRNNQRGAIKRGRLKKCFKMVGIALPCVAVLTLGGYLAFRFGHVPNNNLTAPGSDPNDHIIEEEIDDLPDGEHDDDYFEDVTPEGPSEEEKEDIKDNPHKNDDIDSDNVKKEEEMVK